MKKYLMMFGTAGLLAAMMMVTGCGNNSDDTPAAVTTTTVAGATTTTVAGATTTTVATTTTTLPASQVNVSAAGTSDASTAVRSYVFAAGTYTYTIAGLGAGDKLTFPAGTSFDGQQVSWTDGNYKILATVNGVTTTINLTGLTTAQDNLITNDPLSLNTAIAAGTIQ